MLVITEMQAHLQFFCVIGNERNRALALNGSYGSISFFFYLLLPHFSRVRFFLPSVFPRACIRLGFVSLGHTSSCQGERDYPLDWARPLRTLKKHYVTHIILMIVQMWFEFTHHFFLFHSVAHYVKGNDWVARVCFNNPHVLKRRRHLLRLGKWVRRKACFSGGKRRCKCGSTIPSSTFSRRANWFSGSPKILLEKGVQQWV